MASHDVLCETTDRLIAELEKGVKEANLRAVRFSSGSPLKPFQDPSAPRINVYLYLVSPDENRRAPGRPDVTGHTAAPPLPLRLRYMITAFGGDDALRMRILGLAMQVFHQHATLTSEHPSAPRIQVTLLPSDLGTLNAVWNSTTQTRETSLLYEVSGVFLGISEG